MKKSFFEELGSKVDDSIMVKIPSTEEFLLDNDMADVISMEYLNATDGKSITDYMDIKILLPVLMPKQIEEKIILHIEIAFSQLSKMENRKGCKHGRINVNSISPEGFVIKCGESCSGENCNFLCKWFSKKNEYLLTEFTALKAYLNRTPGNFYTTDIEIQLHILDKTKLDAQQFEILKANL